MGSISDEWHVTADALAQRLRPRDDLLVLEAYVDEGPTMKRIRPRAQGRAGRILKRTSHITIVVGTKEDKKKGDR